MTTSPHRKMAEELLLWYDQNRRELPWRALPQQTTPTYKIWLSEIMLQQTTIVVVKDYYHKFLEKWPNLNALAAAPLEDILRAWAGLGYYARARNLHACAQRLVNDFHGEFPQTAAQLRMLPGIGSYTAGAIASIAFGEAVCAIDGNVARIITRLYAFTKPIIDNKHAIEEKTRALVPKERPGDFAQALMDLGALVCTPRIPACGGCPWQAFCKSYHQGQASVLPAKKVKALKATRCGTLCWISRPDGAILMRRRPSKGLLGAMLEFPGTAWDNVDDPQFDYWVTSQPDWQKINGVIKHSFTHFNLQLSIWCKEVSQDWTAPFKGPIQWIKPKDLPREALPSLMRKAVTLMTAERSSAVRSEALKLR